MIVVHGVLEAKPGQQNLADAFKRFVQQVERDVLAGTFDDYDKSIFGGEAALHAFEKRARDAARCYDMSKDIDVAVNRFAFRLELDAKLFSNPAYGLQRLVHTLASDLFERQLTGIEGVVKIIDVDLSELKPRLEAAYRSKSHDVTAIRNAFALKPKQPLLAFSLKPRACLLEDEYKKMVHEALDGGCQIVELDTRDLELDGEDRVKLLETLSSIAIDLSRERVCRFSANLSGPAWAIKPVIERLSRVHSDGHPEGPWVIKVDGNLDGLSTIQAIRSGQFDLHKQPIITCYPVLKYALQNALGRDAFVRMLAMSGADIIYPGQSPSFRKDLSIDTQKIGSASDHYRKMDLGGYPMLSVAGGVFISSVHAAMSVLGGDIAFFAGGGIALSKQGIGKAARNFAEAIELSRQDLFEQKAIPNLKAKLVDLTRIYFTGGVIPATFDLVVPSELRNVPGLRPSRNL